MKKLKLNFLCDPGHGWVSVKRALVDQLGIADQISWYSYQRGRSVYLEEDSDASKFILAAEAAGFEVVLRPKHSDRMSPIRSYARFSKGCPA